MAGAAPRKAVLHLDAIRGKLFRTGLAGGRDRATRAMNPVPARKPILSVVAVWPEELAGAAVGLVD
jgi:hypothetical protein